MLVISIQSQVVHGHVGNSAALFPLQRLGFDVWPVVTVHFSNHTGYGDWRGPLLSADDIADVIRGVEERGALEECDAVLSGYQGGEDVAVGPIQPRLGVLSAQNGVLVPQDEDLHILGRAGRGEQRQPAADTAEHEVYQA